MPDLISIPPAEAAARLRAGPADLIDVRTAAEFRAVHATGTRLVPLAGFDPAAVVATRAGPAGSPLMLICHSGARAREAGERCIAASVAVEIVDGGTVAWVAAGLPVERGGGSFSVERQTRIVIGLGVLTGAALAWTVHPAWVALSAIFGAGLAVAGITDRCALAALIAAMPWNRSAVPAGSCCISGKPS